MLIAAKNMIMLIKSKRTVQASSSAVYRHHTTVMKAEDGITTGHQKKRGSTKTRPMKTTSRMLYEYTNH